MSKTFYTEEAWHLAAKEDPRNPSFKIMEIHFQKTGDTLVVTESEYFEIEYNTPHILEEEDEDYCEQVVLDGEEYYGDQQDALDVIKVYKVVDHSSGA